MKLVAPSYYERFRCKGKECKNNCCIGWEIDIDKRTLERYGTLRGEIGEKISKSIVKSGDVSHFCLLHNEKCPHLNSDNLCNIILELGEEYLSDICREHPRYYITLGDTVFGGVGLSCEAAAELILSEKTQHGYAEYRAEGFEPEECDGELLKIVLSYKDKLLERVETAESLYDLLSRAVRVALRLQGEIDGVKTDLNAFTCPKNADFLSEIARIFSSLEYMKDTLPEIIQSTLSYAKENSASDKKSESISNASLNNGLLLTSTEGSLGSGGELYRPLKNLFLYFIDRYLLGAVCDGDGLCAIWFACVSTYLLSLITSAERLDYNGLLRLAVQYSEEIEYCEDNVAAIKEAMTPELLSYFLNLR
ncbi:MAG: flagellin lysine-N-methylase [Clostridia bacterium]|nr:flagellin lysine-N-methylase [Clostridia bacterium]